MVQPEVSLSISGYYCRKPLRARIEQARALSASTSIPESHQNWVIELQLNLTWLQRGAQNPSINIIQAPIPAPAADHDLTSWPSP